MKTLKYLSLILLLSGCLANKKDMELAMISTEKYYEYMKMEKVDSIIFLCDKPFFDNTDTAKLMSGLNYLQSHFGNIVNHKLVRTEKINSQDHGVNENKIELTYKVDYSSGYSTKEIFRFYIEKGYNGKIGGISSVKWRE